MFPGEKYENVSSWDLTQIEQPETNDEQPEALQQFRDLLQHPQCMGICNTGLHVSFDLKPDPTKRQQVQAFRTMASFNKCSIFDLFGVIPPLHI